MAGRVRLQHSQAATHARGAMEVSMEEGKRVHESLSNLSA